MNALDLKAQLAAIDMRSDQAEWDRVDALLEAAEVTPPPAHDAAAIAEIAKGLTKAQVLGLSRCKDEWLTAKEIGAAGTTLRSLCFRPLTPDLRAPPSLLSRDYMDEPLRYIYRLTPLGLAVRASLAQSKGEE